MALILAVGMLLSLTTSSSLVGGLSSLLLLASLRHFFFPTRYVIDERGVSMRCLGVEARRAWSRLRRFRYDDAGAFLSTRSRPTVFDAFRSLHLTWAGNKEEVVPVIERYMTAYQN